MRGDHNKHEQRSSSNKSGSRKSTSKESSSSTSSRGRAESRAEKEFVQEERHGGEQEPSKGQLSAAAGSKNSGGRCWRLSVFAFNVCR